MSWFKKKNFVLGLKKAHQRELSRNSSMTYYYKNRDEILEKRRQRYRETGF
jgi:hypothetical protein